MAAKRDRNPPHPARAAAWRAVYRLANRTSRVARALALYAADHQYAARTGRDPIWDRLARVPRSLGD